MSQPKSQVSLLFGAALAMLTITGLTILDEELPLIHTWLTQTFTHHWLGKSVLAVLVFALASVIIRLLPIQPNIKTVGMSFTALNVVTLLCLLALMAFFGMLLV